jgi:hypothetical protein
MPYNKIMQMKKSQIFITVYHSLCAMLETKQDKLSQSQRGSISVRPRRSCIW